MEQKLLIKRAKRGDTHAFAEIYSQVYKKLYQHALYILGNRADAEDVVSETVVEAFDHLKDLKKDEAFDVWIFRILQARCNRKLRDTYVARETVDFEDYVEKHSADSVEALEELVSETQSVINSIDLQTALAKVDPLDREIINLHVVLGYKTAEVASILEMNENTVRSREARALKKLKKLMKEVI